MEMQANVFSSIDSQCVPVFYLNFGKKKFHKKISFFIIILIIIIIIII